MTNLSPAAQAVLDAYRSSHLSINNLAAALQAAADQVVPLSTNRRQNDIRFGLLRIANELEDAQ
jgi:hypothetical protein